MSSSNIGLHAKPAHTPWHALILRSAHWLASEAFQEAEREPWAVDFAY